MSTENQAAQTPAVKKFQENTVDQVLRKVTAFVTTGDLVLPPNYIAENAVRSAWLVLQETVDANKKPALDVCTMESVANALLEMVTKGLSVVKNQCYFVVYGNKLVLEDGYLGKITQAKRDAGVKEVNPVTIYADDVFEYEVDVETGRKKVIKHEQKLQNIQPDKIVGAYAIVNYVDGSKDVEIMTMQQIRQSWQQGGSKGNSPAHRNFPDQMAEKTVINRSLKIEVGSSDDSATIPNQIEKTIQENANTTPLGFSNPPSTPAKEPIEEAQIVKEDPISEPQKSALQPNELFDKNAAPTLDGPGFA